MRMSLVEALRLKDQMPKGLFRGVDGQAANEIWLCAIEAAEQYHGIPRKEQRMNEDIIRMAREAREQVVKTLPPRTFDLDLFHERFAALVRAAEQDRCCRIIFGMAGSDNVAQRTVDAIRGKE